MRKTFEIGRVLIDLTNEWCQVFGKYNWYTLKFVNLEIEWDKYCGSLEFMIAFLGFGLRVAIAVPNELSKFNYEGWTTDIEIAKKKAKAVQSLIIVKKAKRTTKKRS